MKSEEKRMDDKKKVAVVGAGIMGTGIAYAFASSGFAVSLIDTNGSALAQAGTVLKSLFSDSIQRGKIDEASAEKRLAAISLQERVDENLSDAALLIESTTENIKVKIEIFRQVESFLGADTLLATNTSALSISELAACLASPARLVGMHFFNPVPKMKLVELIAGIDTSAEAVRSAIEWVGLIGKDHILVNESPGFTTSRMSAMMGNEAMCMLAEGVASAEDIDKSLRMAFNHPMGPLELGDMTGWDTRLRVLQYLHGAFGEKFRPSPLIVKMVSAGRYGRKTGRGVYEYDQDGRRIPNSGLKARPL
jgi:3-hydroxybutyryl-CoA dehydrogenase